MGLVGAATDAAASGIPGGAAYVFGLVGSQGDVCSGAGECETRFCVDGVCCESACDAGALPRCSACSVALGSTADGVCSVLNDFDGDGIGGDCDNCPRDPNSEQTDEDQDRHDRHGQEERGRDLLGSGDDHVGADRPP